MIYKLGLCGATGRMGLEVAGLLCDSDSFMLDDDLFELSDAIGSDRKFTSVEGVPVRKLDQPPREPVHGWIDFSQPNATVELLSQINEPVLIATTGFNADQLKTIEDYSRSHPVVLASNTSPGINIVNALISKLPHASTMASTAAYDAVLCEEHHRNKIDSPSGTAKTLLEKLRKRGYDRPQIHVTRAGGIKGTHSIQLISDDERIEIRHEAFNRQVFAKGALMGIHFLLKNKSKPGLYSMADVFEVPDD